MAGSNEGSITGSYATGAVDGEIGLGGLAGDNRGIITDSYATGAVDGKEAVGGLVGSNDIEGSITGSHATGNVTGISNVGGLAGGNGPNCSIDYSYAEGNVRGDGYVGGLVGSNYGSITNSHAAGEVAAGEFVLGDFSGTGIVGGLVGENQIFGSISNSYATGPVTGSLFVGGLTGDNRGSITNSFASGDVFGTYAVGGLVGHNGVDENHGLVDENRGRITNSYATGSVTGFSFVGGLVGNNGLLSDEQYTDGIITNSYAAGDVQGEAFVAGLVGINWDSSTISGCFAAGNVTGPSEGAYPPAALVGANIGTITNCFASGLVNGNEVPLVGSIGGNFGTLTNVDAIETEELWNVDTYQESSFTGWVWPISTTDIMMARGTLNPYPYPMLFWEDDGFSSSYTWFIYLEGGGGGNGDNGGNGDDEGDGGSDDPGSGPEGTDWYFNIPTELVWPGEGIPEWARTLIFRGTSGPPSIFSPNFIIRGTSADLLKAIKAYIQASLSFEQNKDSMTEAEYAVAVIELAVAKAAIMIVEARLSGDPAALAAAIEAYEFAQTLLAAHGSYLSGEQAAAISSLMDAIASVISMLSS